MTERQQTRAHGARTRPPRGPERPHGAEHHSSPPSQPALTRVAVVEPLRVGPKDPLVKVLDDLLARVNEWLRFAEGKNGALLGLTSGATLALVATLSARQGDGWLLRSGLAVATALVALSLLLTLASFLPRLDLSHLLGTAPVDPAPDANLLYYGHVALYSPHDLATAVADRYCDGAPVGHLHLDLAAQVITNSRITVGKLRLFAWAVRFFGAGFVVLVATALAAAFR